MPVEDPRRWKAHWISLSPDPREDFGVFGFRRCFELRRVPNELWVRVSADQRYKLYVNGALVGLGPQRGDPQHWFYEVYDIAPHLKAGQNWLAALVWNFGRWAPMAQMSARTGFVAEFGASLSELGLERTEVNGVYRHPNMAAEASLSNDAEPKAERPESDFPRTLSTPNGWQVARLSHWGFDMLHSHHMEWYIDVGPGEIVDFRGAPWGWRLGEHEHPSDTEWHAPNVVCVAEERCASGGGTPWMLVPRTLPPVQYRVREGRPRVRRGFLGDAATPSQHGERDPGEPLLPDAALEWGKPLLLDYGKLLCAYPRLSVRGPRGSTLTLTYCEALWNQDGTKGNRNDVAGKEARGYQDRFVLDGEERTFEPLWWRTFRYLLLEARAPFSNAPHREPEEGSSLRTGRSEGSSADAHASADPSTPTSTPAHGTGIVLCSLDAIETGYPLQVVSRFEADDPWVEKIWDVSVRTAMRCAGETYFDCPYYEQLQYVGDARIQALIGYYLGRDRALQRNAVETLGWSLMENRLTQSRYPSRQTQVIPPFSLLWVLMVWDQMLYDRVPEHDLLNKTDAVLESAARSRDACRFWNFFDWVPEWHGGVPPDSAHLLEYLRALASLCSPRRYLEAHSLSEQEQGRLVTSAEAFIEEFENLLVRFVEFADSTRPRRLEDLDLQTARAATDVPTEHGEAIYRLFQMRMEREPFPWPSEALAKANAARCTYYFSYYKHLAMFARQDAPFDYLTELQPWKEMIESGLTTFAETPEPTRSDCHAWSAHPILGFFQIVAGVTSAAPAWRTARIMPHPGSLRRFDARIAHPDGELRVKFEDGRLEVESPVLFELAWKGRCGQFRAGRAQV